MKTLIIFFYLFLFFSVNSIAGVVSSYKIGTGPLKVSSNTADILEYFFSGGKNGRYAGAGEKTHPWKPGILAISIDGQHTSFFRHPKHIGQVDNKHYAGMAIKSCKKKSGQDCFIFANGYKIKWDNGTSNKSRNLKIRDIKAGKTIAKLTELGFYDGGKTIIKKNKEEPNIENNDDIVKKIKELNELFKSGALTKEEFAKAKKKILGN